MPNTETTTATNTSRTTAVFEIPDEPRVDVMSLDGLKVPYTTDELDEITAVLAAVRLAPPIGHKVTELKITFTLAPTF